MYWTTTTSQRQGHHREVLSEGSRRQNCEPRNTNGIGGSVPGASQLRHCNVERRSQSQLWRQVQAVPGQRNLFLVSKPHANRPVPTRMPGGVQGRGDSKPPGYPLMCPLEQRSLWCQGRVCR